MHEVSLMRDLMHRIERLVRDDGAKSVEAVHLRVGALAHMSPDHLREHFERAAAGGVAEGARLVVAVDADASDERAQDIVLESLVVKD